MRPRVAERKKRAADENGAVSVAGRKRGAAGVPTHKTAEKKVPSGAVNETVATAAGKASASPAVSRRDENRRLSSQRNSRGKETIARREKHADIAALPGEHHFKIGNGSFPQEHMTFNELNIDEPLLRAVGEKGYTEATPIQRQGIPVALAGRDMLGIAQTGTGKTAAFAIPILQLLRRAKLARQGERTVAQRTDAGQGAEEVAQRRDRRGRSHGKVQVRREIEALVLTPTRELAIQIGECFADYGKYTGLQHTVIFGGVKQGAQTDKLRQGVDILVATPGRLLDLIKQGFVDLRHVRHFVLDEADRMLDMGFIADIKRLLPLLPAARQTLFFSATMPQSIASLAKAMLRDPQRVEVTPVSSTIDTVAQSVYYVEKPEKKKLLVEVLREQAEESVLVFSRTKHGADNISRILKKAGIENEAIHGNKSQGQRQRALNDFKTGKIRVMVATDIAARGIDIDSLGMVINYDMPDVAETYVHRIGRTGRAGHSGTALSFCSQEEHPMITDIQKLTGRKLGLIRVS